ncbi:MAG TPA: hypothetical protein PLM81_03805 [Ginsengibacter sp.]|nr:hypothetical protein [Ginsengibacter sp.]HRP44893.1 hypothetical protein [Ginsengibacter sp.]
MKGKYLSFSFSIVFISWIVGMVINFYLKKTAFYNKKLTSLNFIRSERINRILGIGVFKWIVKNTFFRFFNQKIKLSGRFDKADLVALRNEMTSSEIDHLIAFVFVMVFVVIKVIKDDFLLGGIIMGVNIIMNLYPSLLQQEHKRRIDRLMGRM